MNQWYGSGLKAQGSESILMGTVASGGPCSAGKANRLWLPSPRLSGSERAARVNASNHFREYLEISHVARHGPEPLHTGCHLPPAVCFLSPES